MNAVEIFSAILDVAGIQYKDTFIRSGWTRIIYTQDGNEHWFDQWGKKFRGTQKTWRPDPDSSVIMFRNI